MATAPHFPLSRPDRIITEEVRNMQTKVNSERLFFTPQFLQSETGSSLFDSLNTLQRHLSWDDMVKGAEKIDVTVLSIMSDLGSGNGRMKCEFADRAMYHNFVECKQEGAPPVGRISGPKSTPPPPLASILHSSNLIRK